MFWYSIAYQWGGVLYRTFIVATGCFIIMEIGKNSVYIRNSKNLGTFVKMLEALNPLGLESCCSAQKVDFRHLLFFCSPSFGLATDRTIFSGFQIKLTCFSKFGRICKRCCPTLGPVKIYGVPGPGPSTGGQRLLSKKGGRDFFRRQWGGEEIYLRKRREVKT